MGCIEQAESVADDMLKRHATVPLTGTIPAAIKHACADLAAAIFRSRRTPDGKMPTLYAEALARLDAYIKSTYKTGTLVR